MFGHAQLRWDKAKTTNRVVFYSKFTVTYSDQGMVLGKDNSFWAGILLALLVMSYPLLNNSEFLGTGLDLGNLFYYLGGGFGTLIPYLIYGVIRYGEIEELEARNLGFVFILGFVSSIAASSIPVI